MRGTEVDFEFVGFVPPLKGGGDYGWTCSRAFSPGYHMAGFQPEVRDGGVCSQTWNGTRSPGYHDAGLQPDDGKGEFEL